MKYGDVEDIDTTPTIGFNVDEIQFGKMVMTLWDLGAQEKMRQQWSEHYGKQWPGCLIRGLEIPNLSKNIII